LVDVQAEAYAVARDYMVRLEKIDFDEPHLSDIAAHTNLEAAAFRKSFERTVQC
jgi:hypothetical protein